jgi:hypothetical protein
MRRSADADIKASANASIGMHCLRLTPDRRGRRSARTAALSFFAAIPASLARRL